MPAPPDLSLAQMFTDEVMNNYEVLSEVHPDVLAAYMYVISAIVSGNWIDVRFLNAIALAHIDAMPFRPLLRPYFSAAPYTAEDMVALKVAHSLK